MEVVEGKQLMVKPVATIPWARPGHKRVAAMDLLWLGKGSKDQKKATALLGDPLPGRSKNRNAWQLHIPTDAPRSMR